MRFPINAYVKFKTSDVRLADGVFTLIADGTMRDEIQLGHQILMGVHCAYAHAIKPGTDHIIPLEFKYLEFLEKRAILGIYLESDTRAVWTVTSRDIVNMTDVGIYMKYIHVSSDGTFSMSVEKITEDRQDL